MKNNMYHFISFSFLLVCIFSFSSCKTNTSGEKTKHEVPSAKGVTDLALMYHTFSNRPKWTPDEIKHFLYRDNGGKAEWLFDGFLFLEIYATVDGVKYDYGIANSDKIAPDKKIWECLLTETFSDRRGPNALEIVLDSLAQKGQLPPYKRKVMFSIPNPQYGQTNWGDINGQVLDFNKAEDRLTAAKWYIDQLLEIWNKQEYNYLDFAGFYWLHETIDGAPNNDGDLVRSVASYLKEKDMDLCWIPYNWADGVEQWREYGFSVVYQQPNYFFDTKTELWVLERGINFAKEQGIGLEMEFDESVINNEKYLERYYTYINEFEKKGVWENQPVAYYHGGSAWLEMARSKKPEIIEAHKTLADILVKRQGKFSTIIKKQ